MSAGQIGGPNGEGGGPEVRSVAGASGVQRQDKEVAV